MSENKAKENLLDQYTTCTVQLVDENDDRSRLIDTSKTWLANAGGRVCMEKKFTLFTLFCLVRQA